MRPAQLLATTVAFGLAPGLASGQTPSKPTLSKPILSKPAPTSTDKPMKDLSVLKVKPTVYVPSQVTVRGARVTLIALVLDPSYQGIPDRQVTFRVRDGDDKLVQSCTGRTDSFGRATCTYLVPSVGYSVQGYTVKANSAGDTRYEPAVDEGRLLLTEPAHTGRIKVRAGPMVRVGPIEGMVGRVVKLRAQVSMGHAPVTTGRVRFWANGTPLTTALVDGNGLARADFRLQRRHVGTFLYSSDNRTWMGPIHAWYEPPAKTKLRPGLGIGVGWFGDSDNTCKRLLIPRDERCFVKPEAPTTLETKIGVLTVHKSKYGQATVNALPRVTVAFAKPADPQPNPDCKEGYSYLGGVVEGGVPKGFCRRSCERLEHTDWDHLGSLIRLAKGDDSVPAKEICSWTDERPIDLTSEAYRLAHDLCADKALKEGRSDWAHTVNTTLPHWLSAAYRFRDPHTVYESGGWRAHLSWETHIREATVQLPVSINCRN